MLLIFTCIYLLVQTFKTRTVYFQFQTTQWHNICIKAHKRKKKTRWSTRYKYNTIFLVEIYTLIYVYQKIPWEKNYITATIDVTFAQSIKVFLVKFDRSDYMTEDITDVNVYNTTVGKFLKSLVLEGLFSREIIFYKNNFK